MTLFVRRLFFHRKRAQSNPLVYFNIFSNNRSFADYHAGPVIDKKRFAYYRAGVYIDTGTVVYHLAHHPGDEGDLANPEEVRHTVNHDGLKAGVGKYHLRGTFRRGISPKGRLHVQRQGRADIRYLLEEFFDNKFRRRVTAFPAAGKIRRSPAHRKANALFRFPDKFPGQMVDLFGGDKAEIIAGQFPALPKPGKNNLVQPAEYIQNGQPAGKIIAPGMVHQAMGPIRIDQRGNTLVQSLHSFLRVFIVNSLFKFIFL